MNKNNRRTRPLACGAVAGLLLAAFLRTVTTPGANGFSLAANGEFPLLSANANSALLPWHTSPGSGLVSVSVEPIFPTTN